MMFRRAPQEEERMNAFIQDFSDGTDFPEIPRRIYRKGEGMNFCLMPCIRF